MLRPGNTSIRAARSCRGERRCRYRQAGALVEVRKVRPARSPGCRSKYATGGALEFFDIDKQGGCSCWRKYPGGGRRCVAFVARFLRRQAQASRTAAVAERRAVAVVRDRLGDGDVYFLRAAGPFRHVLASGSAAARNHRPARAAGRWSVGLKIGKGPIAAMLPLSRQRWSRRRCVRRCALEPSRYGRDPDTSCSGFNRIRRRATSTEAGQEVRGTVLRGCHGGAGTDPRQDQSRPPATCARATRRAPTSPVSIARPVSAAGALRPISPRRRSAISHRLDNPWTHPAMRSTSPARTRSVPTLHARSQGRGDGGLSRRVKLIWAAIYPLASILARGRAGTLSRARQRNGGESRVRRQRRKPRRRKAGRDDMFMGWLRFGPVPTPC